MQPASDARYGAGLGCKGARRDDGSRRGAFVYWGVDPPLELDMPLDLDLCARVFIFLCLVPIEPVLDPMLPLDIEPPDIEPPDVEPPDMEPPDCPEPLVPLVCALTAVAIAAQATDMPIKIERFMLPSPLMWELDHRPFYCRPR